MSQPQTHERYPALIVVVTNLVSLAIIAIGAYVLATLWIWLLVPCLLYCLWLEYRLLQTACVNCSYYDEACAFGKGKLCAVVFAQGDPQTFGNRDISWLAVLPDFLVSILPLIGSIALLVLRGWNWLTVALLVLLLAFAFGAPSAVRNSLACKYCKQRQIAWPAHELFGGISDG
jgi:hypothetical protein